uniref:Mothers against decapentaplegic homolog n=1 Tax=Ciona intestinalis TaxID=7719 RepID=F6RBZ6_CIOIN
MLTLYRKRQLRRKLKRRILKQNPKEEDSVQAHVHALIASFEENQLENLFLALDSRGCDSAPCVQLSPEHQLDPSFMKQSHEIMVCKAFQWPDLENMSQLCLMPYCESPQSNHICLNPYHYSKYIDLPFTSMHLCHLENPSDLEHVNLCKDYPSETETGLSSIFSSKSENQLIETHRSPYSAVMTRSRSSIWCTLAYWEERDRVGRLYPVKHNFVNVFDQSPKGEGFCLSAVSSQTSRSAKVRRLIGHGVTIGIDPTLQEASLYNRSDYPVFVNSPVLEPIPSRSQLVHKVLPGECCRIFSHEVAADLKRLHSHHVTRTGPYNPYTVRISFVKGWGGNTYRRQVITSCPCWLEILFNPSQHS